METYKVVVLGSGGVGKSAITLQFVQGRFLAVYDPTIEDTYKKNVSVKGTEITLDILDTAGQDDFTMFQTTWIRGGNGFLVVFAVDSTESFQSVDSLVDKIRTTTDRDDLPINVCGNKCDLPNRAVTKDSAESTARELNVQYFETCAKTNMNITEVFMNLAERMRAQNPAASGAAPASAAAAKQSSGEAQAAEGGCGCEVQ
jgi:small GTP-binding protein